MFHVAQNLRLKKGIIFSLLQCHGQHIYSGAIKERLNDKHSANLTMEILKAQTTVNFFKNL